MGGERAGDQSAQLYMSHAIQGSCGSPAASGKSEIGHAPLPRHTLCSRAGGSTFVGRERSAALHKQRATRSSF